MGGLPDKVITVWDLGLDPRSNVHSRRSREYGVCANLLSVCRIALKLIWKGFGPQEMVQNLQECGLLQPCLSCRGASSK